MVLIIQHHNHLLCNICNKYALLFWHHKIILGFSRLQIVFHLHLHWFLSFFTSLVASNCTFFLFFHFIIIIIIICTSRNWRSIQWSPPLCIFMLGFLIGIGKLLLKMVILTPLNIPNLTWSCPHPPLQLCSLMIIAWQLFSIFNLQLDSLHLNCSGSAYFKQH